MSTTTSTTAEREPLVLHFELPLRKTTAQEFFELCQPNRDLRLELTSEGDLIIMPPVGGKASMRNAILNMRLGSWAEKNGTGHVYDSSIDLILPNGAKRSPDFAWVANERWTALTEEEQEQFPPLCPDFVQERRVYVYCSGAAAEELDDPQALSGEPLLGGLELELELQEIWD